MYDRTKCGIELGDCEQHNCIHFTCPQCAARHDRGYAGYTVGAFRCLRCGYSGHGLHQDADIDREVFAEWEQTRVESLYYGGFPVTFTFPDPLNGPG